MSTADLVATRWRRFGHDRLYVTRPDETKVGWWDLVTDEPHPETPEDMPHLEEAVSIWRTTQLSGAAPTAGLVPELTDARPNAADQPATAELPVPEQEIAAPAVAAPGPAIAPERPWIDLVTNSPGAEAREQALAAKDAAPVRTFLARALGVHTDERAWRIGADGEEKVAARLAKVMKKDSRWRVIHAIPVGNRGADIDHLVIGPGGVFTVNAKHHPGAKIWVGGNTFLVNGHKQPYVRNARHEAARAAELLTAACGFAVHVEGLIVVVNADDVVIKSQPDGVSVVPRMQLHKWLLRHGDILDVARIEAIHDVARRSTTWRP